MENFRLLDIPLSRLIKDPTELIANKGRYYRWKIDPADILKDDVYALMQKFGNTAALVAQLPIGFSGTLHSDKDMLNDNFNHNPALNMLLSGTHSMQWFNMDNPGIAVPLYGVNRSTTQWKTINGGTIIDEWTTGDVVTVRTDIPHQVHNKGRTPRTTLSLRWTSKEITWEEFNEWAFNELIPALKNSHK